jgi:hypothetical protein
MEEMMVHLIVGTMVFAAGFLIAFGFPGRTDSPFRSRARRRRP